MTGSTRGYRCAACGNRFGTVNLFDLHRAGPVTRRLCLNPRNLGLTEDSGGVWWNAGQD